MEKQTYSAVPSEELESAGYGQAECSRCHKNSSPTRRAPWFLLHFLFICSYSLLFWYYLPASPNAESVAIEAPFSPAHVAIKEKVIQYDDGWENSPYSGEPCQESDQAWHKLMENTAVRITPDELQKLNSTSSMQLNSGDFVVGLGVYHELHCLKKTRQLIHADYYYPNMTEEEHKDLLMHSYHCIELLRQASMCRADVIPFTLKPATPDEDSLADLLSSGHHKCVDWDHLNDWVSTRSLGVRELQDGLVA
ncbi:MAG: hypothetical protein MMC23_001425 [Stictis urceolatum]|nr:hypothetical protein [Stictis urceolata]